MVQYRSSRTQLMDVQEKLQQEDTQLFYPNKRTTTSGTKCSTPTTENYNKRTESISDRNNELHRIKEQLEDMKHLMDEKGTNISDATPVVRMKNAIKKLADELKEMEVRIGVVSHTLVGVSMKNKRMLQAQAALDSDDDDD
eukprot:gene25833-11510_t